MLGRPVRLLGIYHAEGSFIGELQYLIGKFLGRTSCALCDISHHSVRQKPAFSACLQALPLEMKMLHLDELSADLYQFVQFQTPCVVAQYASGYHILLPPRTLQDCQGDVHRFQQLLQEKLSIAKDESNSQQP